MQKYIILFSLLYGIFSNEVIFAEEANKDGAYEYGGGYEYGSLYEYEYYPYIFTKQPTFSPSPKEARFTKFPTDHPTKKPSRTRKPSAKPTLKPSKTPTTRRPTKLPVPKTEWRKIPTRCRKYIKTFKK
jgi:hypothetical protein